MQPLFKRQLDMVFSISVTPIFLCPGLQSAQKRQGRGRALLSLIELFEQDFDLFEMEPASYDQIVANFGKSGLQQVWADGRSGDSVSCW